MIKKFKQFENSSVGNSHPTAKQRFDANLEIFQMAMAKLKEIMDGHMANSENPHWGDVGSLSSINERLVDIIEGYDEELAEKLHALMNPPR